MGCEVWVPIANDFVGDTESSINVVKIQGCDLGARYRCEAGQEYCSSRTAVIDDSKNGIKSFALG